MIESRKRCLALEKRSSIDLVFPGLKSGFSGVYSASRPPIPKSFISGCKSILAGIKLAFSGQTDGQNVK